MNRRWAAGLVAVLMAAGLGACGDGDEGGGDTDAGGRPMLPASGAGGVGSESAAMAADAVAGDAAGRSIAPARPREYRVGAGVEAPATEASAHRLVEAEVTAAELEEAIGDPGGTVDVQAGRWTFHREMTATDGDTAVSSSPAGEECKVGDCSFEAPPPPPGVPSAAEAEDRFAEILRAIDVDPAGGRFVSDDTGDAGPIYQRVVTYEPVVAGVRVVGLEHTIAFGENGRVEWANGIAGRFEELGEYPLVGVAEALERQQDMDGTRTAMATDIGAAEPAIDPPAPAEGDTPATGGGTSGSAGSGPPGQTEPGSPGDEPSTIEPVEPTEPVEPDPGPPPAPVEPEIVEITGAELVLLAIWPRCEGDDLVLVPAFELAVGDDVHLTVAAVEESSMVQPDPDAPYEPCPGEEPMDEPVGRPEPAPMPPDAGGREPANP